jgi:hypothetical protein
VPETRLEDLLKDTIIRLCDEDKAKIITPVVVEFGSSQPQGDAENSEARVIGFRYAQ